MKLQTLPVLLIPLFIACNGHKKTARSTATNKQYSFSSEEAEAKPKRDFVREQTCQNKPSALDYKTNPATSAPTEEDSRIQALIDAGNYDLSTNTRSSDANFQGASGAGTGSSYASTYYGSEAKKDELNVCIYGDSLINKKKSSVKDELYPKEDPYAPYKLEESSSVMDADTTSMQEGEFNFDTEEYDITRDSTEVISKEGNNDGNKNSVESEELSW